MNTEKTITHIPAREVKAGQKKQKLRVAAYCRVSTEHEEQLHSFENQLDYYQNLIRNNPDYEFAGIFSDEGISGTGVRKRCGFQSMLKSCRRHEIDLLITKSISRFARNTADCLRYSRELRNLGIPIIFEKENINTMENSGELLFTILSSLAQEESRNISENTQWGIRSLFRQGVPHLNSSRFFGYDMGPNRQLRVNAADSKIVLRIYEEFLSGRAPAEIARRLNQEGILGVTGWPLWSSNTIVRMLRNEKYRGDLLLQKWYTADYLRRRVLENHGQQDQYLVKNAHAAIVSPKLWDAAQEELRRRRTFQEEHRIRELYSRKAGPFFAKLFCSSCGGRLREYRWIPHRESFWICIHAEKHRGFSGAGAGTGTRSGIGSGSGSRSGQGIGSGSASCSASPLLSRKLYSALRIFWNRLYLHRREFFPMLRHLSEEDSASPLRLIQAETLLRFLEEGLPQNDPAPFIRSCIKEVSISPDGIPRFRLHVQLQKVPGTGKKE